MGRRILHTGELGSASILKVMTNYLATVNLTSIAEALTTMKLIGMDINYIRTEQRSTVSLEAHICYHSEAMLGDELRVETRIVDYDSKRAHVYQEMYHDDRLLATQETLSISFDIKKRKTCDFDPRFIRHYKFLCETQVLTPIKGELGKSVKLSIKKSG